MNANIVNCKNIISLNIIVLGDRQKSRTFFNMILRLTYFNTGQYHYSDVSPKIQNDKYEQPSTNCYRTMARSDRQLWGQTEMGVGRGLSNKEEKTHGHEQQCDK